MNNVFDYMAEANVTASNQFHGDKVPLRYLQSTLNTAIEVLSRLDQIKKSLFYGRDIPSLQECHEVSHGCQRLPAIIDAENEKRGELLIHSIIGKATESGELLELLRATLFEGLPFDETNFIEEVGDGFWYDAIGLNQVRATFDDVQRLNIAKLRHRFPQKFSEHDANNRDLFGERAILEGVGSSDRTACGHSKYEACFAPYCETATEIDLPAMASKLGKQYATLDNWFEVGNVLIGDVIDHPKLGNVEGCKTSVVIQLNTEKGFCETRNTVYKLGKSQEIVKSLGVDTQA